MLEIQNITKQYSGSAEKALDDISFRIEKGEIIALLGENGAGKTTLINIIAGIVKATMGTAHYSGRNLFSSLPEVKKKIGIVHQDTVFDFLFTVKESLKLQAGFYGLVFDEKYMNYLLEKLSLSEKVNASCRSLSGGMKRRMMIAKALIHKPELLILDEPTAGVDIKLRNDMYNFIEELSESGMTIILTTHYLEEAERLCSRILVIRKGRLIKDLPKHEFKKIGGSMIRTVIGLQEGSSLAEDLISSGLTAEYSSPDHITSSVNRNQMGKLFSVLSGNADQIRTFSASEPGIEDVFLSILEDEHAEN